MIIDIDIHADEYAVRQQAKKAAVNQIKYTLDEILHPSDVEKTAETWEEIDKDTLHYEVVEGLSMMSQENQISAIRDLAVVLWRESLPRVPMDDLVFDTHEEAVRNGYWPYDMNRIEVTEMLWDYADEYEYFHEYLDEAEMELHDVMYDAYHPLMEPDV